MIKKIIGSFLINIFALYSCTQIITGFHLAMDPKSLGIVIGAFTLIHLFLKPILNIFLKALNFLTLGLIGLAVDAGILYGLSVYFPQLSISPWDFPGINLGSIVVAGYPLNTLETTLAAALFINLVRSILLWIFHPER